MEGNILISAGSIILFLIGVVGFFISQLLTDLKRVVEETGKNRGRIDLVSKQQENDIKRIEERTTLELCNLSKSVNSLTNNVNALVNILVENGFKTL
tara:strand:+ start:1213 stop:1503 length:291 start_codon:yes stop_codon:yes gene_type:complete